MTKTEFKELIKIEVYGPYLKAKNKLNLFDKIWCKLFSPELNSIYLIRKKMLYESLGGIKRVFARLIHRKLIIRYGIHIDEGVIIGKGLRIAHPVGIVITKCVIGENFEIYQNCTIGQKYHGSNLTPIIGNNVIMFAGSMIIGKVKVCDDVRIGANSLVLKDIGESGDYAGSPVRRIGK